MKRTVFCEPIPRLLIEHELRVRNAERLRKRPRIRSLRRDDSPWARRWRYMLAMGWL